MEESSDSTWTAAVNLISFATNRRIPLELGPLFPDEACIPLMIASAEVERVELTSDIDPGALTRLSEIIRSSPTISSVTLGYFDTAEKPQVVPALASALRDAKLLRELKMYSLHPSLGALNAFVELLDPKSDLQISLDLDAVANNEEELTAGFFAVLRRIYSLQKLIIRYNKIDVKAFSDAFGKDWRSLQNLELAGMKLAAADGKGIGNALESVACRLHTLHLEQNDLLDAGIAPIVEGLLRGYSNAPGKQGPLQKLSIVRNYISEAGGRKVAQLVKASPHLKLLNLSDNEPGSAGAALGESFRVCATTLQDLRLWYCDAGTVIAICRLLAGSYSLAALEIFGIQPYATAEVTRSISRDLLTGTGSLEKLNLSEGNMDSPAAKELIKGFTNNYSLESVNLSTNKGVGTEIADLLESMLHLRLAELDLTECYIKYAGSGTVGRFVAVSSSLRRLKLRWNGFSAAAAKEVCVGVAQSRSIEELSLGYNPIGNEGVKHVAEWVIGKCKTIRKLEISEINMDVEGAKMLAKAVTDVARNHNFLLIFAGEGGGMTERIRGILMTAQETVKNTLIYFI